MTTITRERLLKIQQWRETYGTGSNVMLPAEEAEELARIALVSLTAEPVAWRLLDSPESSVTVTDNEKMAAIWKRNGRNVQPLYSTAHGSADAVGMVVSEGRQPSAHNPDSRIFEVLVESGYEPVPGDKLYAAPTASERERIRREHAEWSQATFGNVGPIGPLKHLSKEALEAAAEPEDLSEWADMQFLLWDAQRRAGITDEQITRAMVEKLAVNKKREWPEPKDGEPRLHIKGQSAPVVPDGLRQALSNAGIAAPESDEMLAATCEKYIQMLVTWVKDRKPFQPVPVVPEEITDESTEQRLMGRRWAHSFCAGWNACRAAMLSGGKS
ncbi:TPA: dATP/dGTP pyrophosphohydrolase domain-containing protein [Salmonella enterica]